jgi:hypothetical protein
VRDPTTGGEVIIKDANMKDFDAARPAIKPSNILMHPFPPPRPAKLNYVQHKIQLLGVACAVGMFLIWIFTAFGNGFWRFAKNSFICGAVGAVLVTLVSFISRGLEAEVDAVSCACSAVVKDFGLMMNFRFRCDTTCIVNVEKSILLLHLNPSNGSTT